MILAAVAAASVIGGMAGARVDAPVDTFTVVVHLHVEPQIASRVLERDLREEAASLWRPYGVELTWVDDPQPECEAPGFAVDAVIERPPFSKWLSILGQATVGVETPQGRSIHLSFDATERVLLADVIASPDGHSVRDREMARALGRVLAHEIGHVLLAAPYHERAGLMRANFAPRDLVDPDRVPFRLTAGGIGRLNSRLRVLRSGGDGL
jgi:hypothetical protein